MASKQVAQTRRRNTSPHFQSTSVFWGTIWVCLWVLRGAGVPGGERVLNFKLNSIYFQAGSSALITCI